MDFLSQLLISSGHAQYFFLKNHRIVNQI